MFQDGSAHASTDILGIGIVDFIKKELHSHSFRVFLLSVYINLHKVYEFI